MQEFAHERVRFVEPRARYGVGGTQRTSEKGRTRVAAALELDGTPNGRWRRITRAFALGHSVEASEDGRNVEGVLRVESREH
jgi:hypothetical protein